MQEDLILSINIDKNTERGLQLSEETLRRKGLKSLTSQSMLMWLIVVDSLRCQDVWDLQIAPPDFRGDSSLTVGAWALIIGVILLIIICRGLTYGCWERQQTSPQIFPDGDVEMN
ncbi:hypothetical protein IGI04_008404 [Brassica rapa subsp. trilocularis]|uniref:Uncharacterized protein n=1 Tax=Brassica rapa subsp. trilocularis TaxID=1813537 RepID=A0ABQ7NMI6_BRACM|nr:hypothetical protein IGI04_008404 [Brassica rapa subsp. trilocularis]